jgi:hypothetical protein
MRRGEPGRRSWKRRDISGMRGADRKGDPGEKYVHFAKTI